MKISKIIQEIISSQYASNLPAGAEYDMDAPYNQEEPKVKQGDRPSEEKYMPVWYGYNAGIVILKDASGKLYTFDYGLLDKKDVEQYADRKVIGYDEDGWPEYSDVEFDGNVLAAYVNDNLDKLKTGVGKKDYNDGVDIVLIDPDLKDHLLKFANEYLSDNKDELIKVLNSYLNESATMSEAKKGKMQDENFVKIVFEYDFPSSQDRLRLINLVKYNFFGQALDPKNPILHREEGDKYLSTYIPEELLKKFLDDAAEFNPQPTTKVVIKNRFRPLNKQLQGGEEIKFFDYTISDSNPPIAVGYLKRDYVKSYRSLLKWNNGGKEAWIHNNMIDDKYFYHGDVQSDYLNPPEGKKLDPDYAKIFFKDETIDKLLSNYVIDDMKVLDDEISPNDDKELKILKKFRSLIRSYGGKNEYVFGKKRASGGQRYVSIPTNKADDFIDAVNNFSDLDFGAGYGETERNIRLEDKSLNEIRKIVRAVINNVIK